MEGGENCGRRFNALSRASQVHFSGNSRGTLPIRPATNQVLFPQNTTKMLYNRYK